jgi:outer membrane protein OmpA-like peptidoglycan-associated protein
MKKIFILIFVLSAFAASSQVIEIDKKEIPNKDDYKKAKDNLKLAENYYLMGRGGFRKALDHYLEIHRMIPNHAMLNYKIGNCYLYSIQKPKCLEYYEKAFKLNPGIAPDILFVLARGYHLSMQLDKAIEYYKKYMNSLPPKELQTKQVEIKKFIEECEYGKELAKNPIRVFIDNAGENINSSYPEYNAIISTDESVMMYTARRPDTYGGGVDEQDYVNFEDIYIAYSEGSQWGASKNAGKPLNTNDHDATVGLSADGQTLFVFNGKTNGGDILVSVLKGTEWSKPDDGPMKKFINTSYKESSASFSFDGRTMYFVSDREGGYGGLDIYMSNWDDKKERWDAPRSMGAAINTRYNEEGVFMHPDGRTLYFSSKGHKTMGGYDIFKSTLGDDGTWSEPENLGYPLNTPDDDVFFVVNASGKRGYMSSVRDEGYGDYDIYRVTFRGPEKPPILQGEDNLLAQVAPVSEVVIEEAVEIKTTRLTIVKGTIQDGFTLANLSASIEIVDNEKNEVVSIAASNSSTGKYLVTLPSGKNYGLAVKSEGYLFHSENFEIPAATGYQEITKDIKLYKMDVGAKIVLKNIFFDYAKATLRSESFAELDRLLKMLNDFPTMRIEISGHTDNQGSLATNEKLSAARAKAVVDYLIAKGISASRLESAGYAFKQPIASNDTEEGRQQNRRVEFKVLSK